MHAPLPDPEGQREENAKPPSNLEKSIVLRLLQAVTLEVLEECLLADLSTMEWATRLIEKKNPQGVVADRISRSKAWRHEEKLLSRDKIIGKFVLLAKDLSLNPEEVFRSTDLLQVADEATDEVLSTLAENPEEEVEESSEFPTSPSQIPYSHLGALFLFLASTVPATVYSDQDISPLNLSPPDLHHF